MDLSKGNGENSEHLVDACWGLYPSSLVEREEGWCEGVTIKVEGLCYRERLWAA